MIGWLFECIYCSIVEKRWCNRGFLFGPVCPIYGAGAVAALIVFGNHLVRASLPAPWAIFLICGIGASCMEWVTSVVMERVFGTVWWDYSDMPLNLKGRVCVPAACLFGICGVAIVYLALPLIDVVVAVVPPLAFEICGLVLGMLFAVDMTLSICTLTEILAAIEHAQGTFDDRVQGVMDAADDRLRIAAETMGARQQHILHNMRRFRTERLGGGVRRLTETLDNVIRKGRRP